MAAAFYPKPYHSICAWTDRFVRVLPDPELHIEAAKFDVQKIMNPDIQKEDYPHGPAYGFWNNRYFVFARDEYTCQICGKRRMPMAVKFFILIIVFSKARAAVTVQTTWLLSTPFAMSIFIRI